MRSQACSCAAAVSISTRIVGGTGTYRYGPRSVRRSQSASYSSCWESLGGLGRPDHTSMEASRVGAEATVVSRLEW